ncbi:MAG: ABC transporter ATP-binding protein [Bacilli bacterium]|nr:ABC transporter ATP-binding protein [Bacilli bacterium]
MDDKKVLVRLENISKNFNNVKVIKDVSLDIYKGEFLTLLGPSGCGKTTILRMISGLDDVTKGKVFIDGVDVTEVDATKREVNTIFQNLALFPKMTVKENVGFGLKMKKLDKNIIDKRVKEVIKLVKMEGYEDRFPSELSGGQQQRIAIARSIIMNPKVLLLDESLCSLDLKLKKSMQIELKRLQKKLGITFIYVTHAQDEALSMSDRIAVINNGKIEQLDTPENIYKNPKTVFVADFIGEANILDGKVVNVNDGVIKVSLFEGYVIEIETDEKYEKNEQIKLIIRPENIKISKKELINGIEGVVTETTYNGDSTKILVDVPLKEDIKVSTTDDDKYNSSTKVYIKFDSKLIVPLRK